VSSSSKSTEPRTLSHRPTDLVGEVSTDDSPLIVENRRKVGLTRGHRSMLIPPSPKHRRVEHIIEIAPLIPEINDLGFNLAAGLWSAEDAPDHLLQQDSARRRSGEERRSRIRKVDSFISMPTDTSTDSLDDRNQSRISSRLSVTAL